jgi:phosphopantothenoylcysteine decarboxylase / phosphopantothenate---cysteine ligase
MGGTDGEGLGGTDGDGVTAARDRAGDERAGGRGTAVAGTGDLTGHTLVVTAGGTREPIDPVRFLGNRSSGRMGFAIAAEAARRGAEVHLVAAPTHLDTPAGVTRHDVATALEMRDVVLDLAAAADVVVKSAAVADFRPASPATTKVKKDAGVPTIELVANPDILAELGASREPGSPPLLVGFAAETDDVEVHGRAKLERKRADLLVVNDVSASDAGFEVDTNRVVILGRDGARVEVPLASKLEVARRILDEVVARL